MSETFVHSFACMGTVVTMQVVSQTSTPQHTEQRARALARGTEWFRHVESVCSRFDPASELRQLCLRVHTPVPVSDVLFEAVQFALAVADASGGGFDPTIGALMAARGFNRHYQTGALAVAGPHTADVSYHDVELDAATRTITLGKPLLLDLGAVAKGLAIDLAVNELGPLHDFMIDAGGDLYLAGQNPQRLPWTVGIRHPRAGHDFIDTLHASNIAVCTSGDYARPGAHGAHHLVNARDGTTAAALASVTVSAPSAMVADALATAAFALGPVSGLAFLEQHRVQGLLVTPTLQLLRTRNRFVD